VTAAPVDVTLVDLSPEEMTGRLDEALSIYVEAMGYAPGTVRQRAPMWAEHARRPGWRAVGALGGDGALYGIAYGYPGAPGQWWFEEVRRGLTGGRRTERRSEAARERADVWLTDYFELTELHVSPRAQGHGLGEGLLRRLLAGAANGVVLLSTPEAPAPTRAWTLYRRVGFVDVLRHHRFSSDPRPFAVLGRTLPVPGPGEPDPSPSPAG